MHPCPCRFGMPIVERRLLVTWIIGKLLTVGTDRPLCCRCDRYLVKWKTRRWILIDTLMNDLRWLGVKALDSFCV
jgi:hypothetical protein